jgi:hypothetical protein
MLFCLGEGKYETKGAGYQKNNCIFNVQVTKKEWDTAKKSLPEIKLGLTHWVDKADMTAQEKKDHSVYKEIGGYLKRFTYEEAWANWWAENDHEAILKLPHFDAEIFEGITGLDVKALSKNPKEIVIDGATYILKGSKENIADEQAIQNWCN